jgi:hypothetical protein
MMRAKKMNKKLDEQEGWTPASTEPRGWRYVY